MFPIYWFWLVLRETPKVSPGTLVYRFVALDSLIDFEAEKFPCKMFPSLVSTLILGLYVVDGRE